ncbi:hypothetical protein HOK51_00610 [Candidatus Woesearchaeota archaeon]|jgi:hypothetical protein|nr:hypothetical protein [Candidatus Woesearchaeota archaeon]MBT6518315.1 hypothetical protein [Candidatus Woesearchaeota archaeon]MBT7366612.1 hypothetical protein [Candidatus Woesearchaeota archaeon]
MSEEKTQEQMQQINLGQEDLEKVEDPQKEMLGESNVHSFTVNEGTEVDNLLDLIGYIESLPAEEFTDFVKNKKRTMTNWLNEVHGDEAFTQKVEQAVSKDEIKSHLKSKLSELDDLKEEAKEFMETIEEEVQENKDEEKKEVEEKKESGEDKKDKKEKSEE